MMAEFTKRRAFVVDGLNKLPGVSCIVPNGAFYAFPNVKGTGLDTRELANRLLDEAGVALLSGTAFGEYGEGYLRVSYANSLENIEEALAEDGRPARAVGRLMAGRIVVTGRVPEPALDVLREAGELDAHMQETALSVEELHAAIAGADAVVTLLLRPRRRRLPRRRRPAAARGRERRRRLQQHRRGRLRAPRRRSSRTRRAC